MASGLNKSDHFVVDKPHIVAEDVVSSPEVDDSSVTKGSKGQFYVGSDDENERGSPSVISSPQSGDHLSFADLMAHQNQDTYHPASDTKRMVGYTQSSEQLGTLLSDSYHPPLRSSSSLDHEMEKFFDEGNSSTEKYQLKMDFSNPALATSNTGYLQEPRYGEYDFESHRRSNVHMYQPMSTHLSSRDLKTIESAQKMSTSDKSKKKRAKPSSGSSPTLVEKEGSKEKSTKRRRKKKKTKRKSLTSKLRHQPTSIPEEDEEESDEDSDEDEEDLDKIPDDAEESDDDERSDERRKRRGGGHEEDGGSGDSITEGKSGESDQTNKQKRRSPEGDLRFIKETQGRSDGETVIFSVGASLHDVTTAINADDIELDTLLHPRSGGKKSSDSDELDTSVSDGSAGEKENVDQAERRSMPQEQEEDSKRHKKHRHRHRKNKGVNIHRRMSGLKLKEMDKMKPVVVTDEDGLQKADIDEMYRHRFDESVGMRKHLLHRPVRKKKMRTEIAERKVHDRKPHEMFVELDELVDGEWKEAARWIKFEEDVEESNMWGKPRVASLSFHSLLELRKTIEKGGVLLDLESSNLNELANAVVDEMLANNQISDDDAGNILRILLSKHKHQHDTSLQYNLSRANISSFFTSSSHAKLNTITVTDPDNEKPLLNRDKVDLESGVQLEEKTRSDSSFTPITSPPASKDLKIMKKIPEGAEAAAVLVGKVENLQKPTMAFVRLSQGRDLDDLVALPIPVRFVFVLLGPSKPDYDYHEIGRSISTLMADKEFRVMAYSAENRNHLLTAINEFLDDSIVLPPGQLENPDLLKNLSKYQDVLAQRNKRANQENGNQEKKEDEATKPDEDPLRRTKRCFGGLIRDVKRRYPLYLSDITDAFNLQCLASVIFIYFAALSPAITFGGLMGEKTNGWIGVSEMILGCCIGGCAFGLFSGQPLLIVGSTGPLIVFEEAVFNFCRDSELPYLASRFWIGLWICVIALVVVAFEGSFLVRYLTRFTQEIFSVLISLIFIYEVFNKLAKTYHAHPLLETYPVNQSAYETLYNCSFRNSSSNQTNGTAPPTGSLQPNTALLSTVLMFGTFIIAYFLRQFKNSKFFRSSVRRTIGDFGVPIAIGIMLAVDLSIEDVYTQKLNVPQGISPTNSSKRGWLVNPLGTSSENPMPVWMIFASAIPAFLVFILIFMESHITEIIVSSKERKLRKGSGFHLNLLVLGILNLVLPIFGMPWVCCAAVRSITHTNSLTIMSTKVAPGEKAQIDGVHEQRVTVFLVNACLGLSILMQPILKEIPLAVLFGIFLYMGVTSLTGVQFVDRIEMLFMPAKHYPDTGYVKMVRRYRIHMFTLIEMACLAVLWVVKSTDAQIAFPFALVLTVPLRFFILPKIFSKKELKQLDNNDSKPSVTSSDLDEYNDAHVPD